MRNVLFVAEKNDVAKGVAGILSGGNMNRREGRSKFNKIYQLQMRFMGQDAQVAITSVSGHLCSLEFNSDMKNWHEVSIERLFDAPVTPHVPPNFKDIARTLTEEARKADILVIWTDCDREGENIGDEIRNVCLQSNGNLDVYRAKFSEITPRAINNAVANLGRLDQRIVEAVYCRSELDLRIGAAFTRLQTLHLQQRFANLLNMNGNKTVVSYGSCQFPTLGFVVERYKAVESFVSEPFWKIVAEHSKNGSKAEFSWDRQRLFDRDVVNILYDDCVEAGVATIESVTKKPKSKFRPQALDTVELEKLAVRKLRMSAKTAMGIAEKLYSKGWISYPRTETNKFPPDINLAALVQQQTANPNWGEFAQEVLDNGGARPRNGSKSDEAHPPIHPLKFATPNQLSGDEWRVYELIVRHFLACVSSDARGQETKVNMRVGGETFWATGLQIDELGYLKVYPYDKWSDKTVPKYEQGDQIRDHNLKISEGATQPPPLLNEADLIALMDKYGIGTDATHAEHIEKIKERQYVGVRDDGRFVPGYLGLALVDGYDDMGFAMSKPQLRADLEKSLGAICDGQRTKQDVLREQIGKYRRIFTQAEMKINSLSNALSRYLNGAAGGNANGRLAIQAAARTAGGGPPPPPRGGGAVAATRARGRSRTGAGRNGDSNTEVTIPDHELSLMQPPTGGAGTRGARRGRPRGSTSTRGTARGRGGAAAANTFPSNDNTAGGDEDDSVTPPPSCDCFTAAVQRTVNKDGPNKGKKFWSCSKTFGAPDKCNFFKWVD